METRQAIDALGALAQETRLAIFRLLVQEGPAGLPAGTIAERLGVPSSSLSFHLAHLTRAGLLLQRRASRSLIYAANFAGTNALVAYLMENCCAGSAATACAPACAATDGLSTAAVAPTDPGLIAALRRSDLPTDDLGDPGRSFFAFRTKMGETVGYAGAEMAGDAALLRSLVVLAPWRGQGHARRMTDWMLRWLAGSGVTDIYLLTTGAKALFERCGFRAVDRSDAPAAISSSRQFAALCPISAVLMHRKERA